MERASEGMGDEKEERMRSIWEYEGRWFEKRVGMIRRENENGEG